MRLRFAGMVAFLILLIARDLLELDIDVFEDLELVIVAALPNYCLVQGLPYLVHKHQYLTTICTQMPNLAVHCELVRSKDLDDPCCQGKLQQGSY